MRPQAEVENGGPDFIRGIKNSDHTGKFAIDFDYGCNELFSFFSCYVRSILNPKRGRNVTMATVSIGSS